MRSSAIVLALILAACGPNSELVPDPNTGRFAAPRAASSAKARSPASVSEPASAPLAEGAPREELAWATFSPETFARAKAERKFIVMDGAAEWCHWCHVMEATTYHDPAVRAALAKSFIAVKVDVDARPDIAERYADWGWPATVIFSPDAMEIGKYKGYIAPAAFAGILGDVVSMPVALANGPKVEAPKTPLAEDLLAWIERDVEVNLADLFDDEEGGWGYRQKAALGYDNEWLLRRATNGDGAARKQALFTLDKQAQIIDPVWGGIYQYSAASDWTKPHFEKLMTFQAPAIENYATAFVLTHDEVQKARALAIYGYVDRFLRGEDGGFYTTQDADLNAHDRARAFVDGHAYYALGDVERRARGIPRVDTHEYGKENGLAIGAYATLYEALRDPTVRAAAEKAARHILATHRARGGISHDVATGDDKTLYLADNAWFALGLMRLGEVTKDPIWTTEAQRLGDFILVEFPDEATGALFGTTKDPAAVGVFATRRVPFEDNVAALRLFARLARATKDAKYKHAIDRVLRGISTPERIKERGRMIGDYLLALEETKGVR